MTRIVYTLLLLYTIWFAWETRTIAHPPPSMIGLELPTTEAEFRGVLHSEDATRQRSAIEDARTNLRMDNAFKFLYPLALIVFAWNLYRRNVRRPRIAFGIAVVTTAICIATGVFDGLENSRLLDNLQRVTDTSATLALDTMREASLLKWGLLGLALLLLSLLEMDTTLSAETASGWTSFRVCVNALAGSAGVLGAVWMQRALFEVEVLGFTAVSIAVLLESWRRGKAGAASIPPR